MKAVSMKMKALLTTTATAMVALTVPLLVTPAPATAAGEHFVRFSNKNVSVMRWCTEARDKNNAKIKGDCDQVPVRATSTFKIPAGTDHVAYKLTDAIPTSPETYATGSVAANQDWCFRYTISGSFHEAKDKPCKL